MIRKKKGVKRVVLIDTHAVLHRGYHALPDFTTKSGEHTGAVYGLATFLLSIIKELEPDYLVATYDLPGGTFRHEQYKEYKATRGDTDDALITQFDLSRQLYEALGIPIYDAKGFEADDILGTAVCQLKKRDDVEIIIASGDMDTLQLVEGTTVRVYTLRRGLQDTIVYDERGVKDRFGFAPKYLIDYKGLRGDPSDNIPGVPGIGEKTATSLVGIYGSLENIYKALKKDRVAFLKKAGVTERVAGLLEEHKDAAYFSRELATIRLDAPVTIEIHGESWHEHVDADAIDALCVSLEFRSLRSRFKKIGNGFVVDEQGEEDSVRALKQNKETNTSEDEFDPALLERTRIMYWLLHSDRAGMSGHNLIRELKVASLEDADKILLATLKKEDMLRVWEEIEEPLIVVIKEIEEHGVLVDIARLATLKKEYTAILKKKEKKIHTLAGVEFNINSPKQLGEIIFDTLEVKGVKAKKTATGAYSTSATQLEKLRDIHPIAGEVLEYREVQKLLSTYIEPLPRLVGGDGRIHATFDQAGTTTGRFSSRDPNLQNIPTKSELGRAIRTAFVAPKESELLALDYSQIELRVAAWLSGDVRMVNAFNKGGDFHSAVAAQIFNKEEGDISKTERRAAKVINFGIVYGMGVSALKQNLGVSTAEAREFYDRYRERFARLFEYFEEVKQFAREHGYTQTYFGHRRAAPDIKSRESFVRSQAERYAMNAPLQGTGADIVKLGMVALDNALKKEGIAGAHMVLQVHDEVVLEVKKSDTVQVARIAKDSLEGAATGSPIPFVVDVSRGPNWGALTRIDV